MTSKYILLIGLSFITNLFVTAQVLTEPEIAATMYHAFELHKDGQYTEALNSFLCVGSNVNPYNSELERQIYVCSQTMACSCYFSTKQYYAGYLLSEKLLKGALLDEEKNEVYHQYVLNGYMTACGLMTTENDTTDYNNAYEILQAILPLANSDMRVRILSKIPLIWYYTGAYYHMRELFEQALDCYASAERAFAEIGSISNTIFVLKKQASIHAYLGQLDKAIMHYQKAFLQAKQNRDIVEQMSISEQLYGLYDESNCMERKYRYAQILDSLYNTTQNLDAHVIYYQFKGNLCQERAEYKLAEQWFLKAMDIAMLHSNSNFNHDLLLLYFDLGELYHDMNRYDDAIKYIHLSFGGDTQISKTNYLKYIILTSISIEKDDIVGALEYLNILFSIEPDIKEPRLLSKLYSMRAKIHSINMDYHAAIADYKKADELLAIYPVADEERTRLYAAIGSIEHQLHHYKDSQHYYDLYAKSIKYIYGENSLKYINAQIYLANANGFAGNLIDGCSNYASAITKYKNNLQKRLPYMNTVERESFWEPISLLVSSMTPYAIEGSLYQTKFTKTCYDMLLLSKGFLLASEQSLDEIIYNNGNESDIKLYQEIKSLDDKIIEWEKNYRENVDNILFATNRRNQIESKLMNRCSYMDDFTAFMDIDYKSVKNVLKPNEIVLDFTDFLQKNGDRQYAAYVIDKKRAFPLLKPLFIESQIDSLGIVRPDMFYDTTNASDILRLLWNPFEEYVEEGMTIYYVPSQLLFQICLESLPLEDGTLLGEHYNFVRLSSARELVKNSNSNTFDNASAILYGGLQYDIDPKLMIDRARQYDLSSFMTTSKNEVTRGSFIFDELPGTAVEVEKITKILHESNIQVTPYVGEYGTEESFFDMYGKSPKILHIATHGFFYTPEEASEENYLRGYTDAMLLSGLIMAGGNSVWRGDSLPDGVLGGVLTANEIAGIDLRGTDIVVLSSCQSGRGKVTAEGLYGLQRAFKKAGVNTLVMTLWEISDIETAEFMVAFYERLIKNNWDKRAAFKEAQIYFREHHPDPYYWASFVMLD